MNTIRTGHPLLLAGISIILAALACNAPGPATTPTAPTPTAPEAVEISPTAPGAGSPTPSPTDTPTATPTTCVPDAAFVSDVTVPDDSEFAPGEAFTKVWRVRNSGACAWEPGTRLVFVSGERMNGPAAVDVPAVAPGSTTDVSVDLAAPTTPGTYRSAWQLEGPDGTRFGDQIYVQIVVPAPATQTPTPTQEPTVTSTPVLTQTPTEQPAPPDLVITNLEVDTDDPRQGAPLHIVATLHNQGGTIAENFRWAWRVCVQQDCEYTEAPGAFTLEPGEEVVAQMEYVFEGWANYTTEAWVDSREKIEESDETNNTRQLVIPVKEGLPDLVVAAVTFDPDPPVKGQSTTVRLSIRNRGSRPAGVFDIEWWASVTAPAPACEWTLIGGLTQGETAALDCKYTYPSWYSKITTRAIVDANEAIAELDETNNALERETPVQQP